MVLYLVEQVDMKNDGFYLDSGGKFSLGNKLSWNGSSLSLEGHKYNKWCN